MSIADRQEEWDRFFDSMSGPPSGVESANDVRNKKRTAEQAEQDEIDRKYEQAMQYEQDKPVRSKQTQSCN